MGFLGRLMPHDDRFVALFEAHAAETVAAAAALRCALAGDPGGLGEVSAREEAADAVTRDILLAVRKAFITPFDRGAIKDLAVAMDDSIDEMNKFGAAVALFGVREFTPPMREMGDLIGRATGIVGQAVPLLRSMGTEATAIIDLCGRVVTIEGEADTVHGAGIKALWDGRARNDVRSLEDFIVGERLLGGLEKVMDRLEDVADVIHGIVIEHV